MKLDRCSGCGGFVPTAAKSCPHCWTGRKVGGALVTLAVSTAVSFTLMACYGGPPPPEPNTPQPSNPTATGDAGK